MSATQTTPLHGSVANGAPTAPASATTAAARANLKMASSATRADGSHALNAPSKQLASPVDAAQRKPAAPKAWTQGTNPITQRPTNVANANGLAYSFKPPQAPTPNPGSTTPLAHLSERMLFLLAQCIGAPAEFTLKNGEKYSGVLSGDSLQSPAEVRYIFKMVKRIPASASAETNGTAAQSDDYIGSGENHVMSFDIGDVADLHCPGLVFDKAQSKTSNGASSAFRTDTDISGNTVIRERNLQKWEPSADSNVGLSLESTGRSTEWDQFTTNEQLFGVKSNYDENIYTTTIDRSNPQYAERAARAEKIAREIEGSSSLNAHVREERGHTPIDDKGADEEDKYSGVQRGFPPLRSAGPNKYTPPARRPPMGLPTVPGAPVDPAIISAQLARPGPPSAVSPPEKRGTPEPLKAEASSKSEIPTAPKTEAKAAPPTKLAADQQKAIATLKSSVANSPAPRPGNATGDVENQLLKSFKEFSTFEKNRLIERQKALARESKAVKLNDLKKFSQNFKLNTPVPQDLVPILAKDEAKQQEIVQKAQRAVDEKKAATQSPPPVPADAKAVSRTSSVKPDSTHPSPSAPVDRQQNQRLRQGQNHYGPATARDRVGLRDQGVNQGPNRTTGILGNRLALNQQQHKQQGTFPYNAIPHPIPPHDSKMQDLRALAPSGPSAASSGNQTPTNGLSTRFNVRAHEFKPNPAANTFQPGGIPSTKTSPRPSSASSKQEVPPQVTRFFGGSPPKEKKELDLNKSYNPMTRMMADGQEAIARMKEDEQEAAGTKLKDFVINGGIAFPFRTPPTWDYPDGMQGKSYITMFEESSTTAPISAPHNPAGNGSIPHQHQLPLHLQGNQSQGHTPQQTPRGPPVQPNHGQGGPPQFDGHAMQFSHSTSSVQPSPRAIPPFMYNTQAQSMAGFPQQAPQMQGYQMSPVMPHAGLRQQGGPQYMNAAGMGGQMMTPQPSNGPYMGMPANPQAAMYSTASGPAYAHYPNQMSGPPGANGYSPSLRHGAPMMHHQGSQQGHQQQFVYMQQGGPMFAQMPPGPMNAMRQQPYPQHPQQPPYPSPQQHHQYPQHTHRGTSSGSYSQPMIPQHSMTPQGPPPTGPANHGQEGNDEAK